MRPLRLVLTFALMLPISAQCNESKYISDAKSAVRLVLKDPDSAQFSDLVVVGNVVCGYVNAKNSFGGYEGRREFIYPWGENEVLFAPTGSDANQSKEEKMNAILVNGLCEALRNPEGPESKSPSG